MKDKLIESFRNAFRKARPAIVLILVILFLIYPYLPELSYTKLGVGVSLGLTILLMLFEFSKDLTERLDNIDSKLKNELPPSHQNFNTILPVLEKLLKEKVMQNRDVNIFILSVSGQFTWKLLIEDMIPELLNIASEKNKPKLNIEFVLVQPDVLGKWGQNRLKKSAEDTLDLLPIFKTEHKSKFDEGRISLEIHQYDNIPHWHAILIDDEDLFFGKCNWQVKNDGYSLQVGQLQYKQFSKNDRFEGNIQIDWVKNWFDVYKSRSQENRLETTSYQ